MKTLAIALMLTILIPLHAQTSPSNETAAHDARSTAGAEHKDIVRDGMRGVSLSVSLQVLTYNVQFRPRIADLVDPGWPNTEARAAAIGRAIACYDLIALREVFHADRLNDLRQAAERAGQQCGKPSHFPSGQMFAAALGPQFQPKIDYFPASAVEWFAKGVYNLVDNWVSNNRWALAIEDSGLVLLSRYPIAAVHHHTFRSRRGFDAWAHKGVLHAVIQLDTTSSASSLDVFVTHLQARRYHHARREQIKELTRFIRKHRRVSAIRPALVMGDFNIDGNTAKRNHASAQYGVLNSALRRVIPNVVDVWRARHATTPGFTNPKRNKRIDYIFATAHEGFVTEHVGIQEFFIVPNDTSLDFVEPAPSHAATTLLHTLSDHAGVVATLVWIRSE